MSAVTDVLGRRIFSCDCSNRSVLGCFSPRTYGPTASKRSTGPNAVVEEWRSIATSDDLKLRALAPPVKHLVQSRRMSRPDFNLALRFVSNEPGGLRQKHGTFKQFEDFREADASS